MRNFDAIKQKYEEGIKKAQQLYANRKEVDTAGGVRDIKGKIVESITQDIIKIAWSEISNEPHRLTMDKKKTPIKFNKESDDLYKLSQDINVYINGKFKISVECKAYAEVAMYKRIIVDAYLLKKVVSTISAYFLVQLENFMGGDYGERVNPNGSPSVRTLNKFFDGLNIKVITLLDGDRDIKRPIHIPNYHKSLSDARLNFAVDKFKEALKN